VISTKNAHGVKTPWQPRGAVLCCRHESIITRGCSASFVRRRRILLWRSCHWRRRPWLGSADLPRRLSLGRIPAEKVIAEATNAITLKSKGLNSAKVMKDAHWLVLYLIAMALATGAQGQSAVTSVPASRSLETPTSDFLVLSNATGEVRVLDSKGLLLESEQVYLPRINLADLSLADLQALLETKTAYAALTAYGAVQWTNAQSAVIENQLQQVWQQGKSLAERMQTRLEILGDLREYNYNLDSLSGSLAAVSQDDAQAAVVHDQLTNRAAIVVTAAAQVDLTEQERALGVADAGQAERQARESYGETTVRLEKANDRAIIANGQAANANQQVADNLANCAALSTRLASHGINVPGVPPFYPIPSLRMKAEVDAQRMAN